MGGGVPAGVVRKPRPGSRGDAEDAEERAAGRERGTGVAAIDEGPEGQEASSCPTGGVGGGGTGVAAGVGTPALQNGRRGSVTPPSYSG